MEKRSKKLNITNNEQKYLLKKFNINKVEDLDIAILRKLKESLKTLTDPRQQSKVSYKIWDIVICVVLANLTPITDWEDIPMFVESKKDFLKQLQKFIICK